MTEVEVNGLDVVVFDITATKIALFASSTKIRLEVLENLESRLSSNEIQHKNFPSLLNLFFDTYPYYCDRNSRRAVQRCIRLAFQSGAAPEALTAFITLVHAETLKQSIAPANAFVLVEWCSVLLQEMLGTNYWPLWGLLTIECNSRALELCHRGSPRSNMKRSALAITWRALRNVFYKDSQGEILDLSINRLCSKTSQPSAKNAIILGAIAGVCARKPEAQKVLISRKSDYYAFYVREIIGSRTQVQAHIACALEEFFSAFAKEEDLGKEVVPALEKALLRAPEIVLDDILTPLFNSLPTSIDLSKILLKNLIRPLISCAKSTHHAIRHGALSAFKSAILKCTRPDLIVLIGEEILNPLKSGKLPSADQREAHAEMLSAFPISKNLVVKVLPALAFIAGREANEAALVAEISAIHHYLIWGAFHDMDLDEKVIDSFLKGICDKKTTVKKLWAVLFGELNWAVTKSDKSKLNLSILAELMMPKLVDIWQDVNRNSITAAQSGLVTCAYIFAALCHSNLAQILAPMAEAGLKRAEIAQQALTIEPKLSFLLNPRVYGKLTTSDDFKWFIRALLSFSQDIESFEPDSPISVAWSQALIFCVCSANASCKLQKDMAATLSALYKHDSARLSRTIIVGLWHWRNAIEMRERDSAAITAKTENQNLHLVIKAICLSSDPVSAASPQISKSLRRDQMISLLVLSRPELVPNISWIDLCLKIGVDPGDLARSSGDSLLYQIQKYTSFDENIKYSNAVRRAAFNAAAELAFVAPEDMTKRIVELIEQDLDPNQLSGIGPTESAIFHNEDGTPTVDALASKAQTYIPNKNTKYYDTLRWEEELRTQLAKKKGQQKKLTPEETAKVNAQLKKEASIRLHIRKIEARISRGIGIIQSLGTGPPTDATLWMGPAIKSLLGIINAGAGIITGSAAPDAYISCAQRLPSRIGELRPFIGIATLRALNVPSLPENLTQEPLSALITRVLYRLRFSGEQRQFDTVSLVYILPLVLLVLRNGGFGETDDAEAQLVLALELLSFHTDAFSNSLVPREELLSVLILSMQSYNQHYKLIKDCLAGLCRCIAPNITSSEISVLCRGSIFPQVSVRTSVLQSISAEIDLSELYFSEEIWLACHDDVEENIELGREIWEESGFEITDESPLRMLPYLERADKQLRRAAARALAHSVQMQPTTLENVLKKLQSLYQDLAKPHFPQLDAYGMPKKIDLSDPWEARNGIALAFKELAPMFEARLLDSFLRFLIESGPLGDKNSNVREEMVEAATSIISVHGKSQVEDLMITFEETLEAPDKESEFADRVNEAVIIMYGALARHLKSGDSRVPKVVRQLLETLTTPSEAVQFAVAECLPPLVQASLDDTPEFVQNVLDCLFSSKTYASRRGAAYGLAGVVHGRGISALKEYRIMSTLKAGTENKKDLNYREGSLLAYELLSTILGRVFEPYVIQIVPQLLSSFGDASADVRDSCLAAAKACFARLSSFGVKRILPTLLEGLDDQHWRSKKGACDLLGAMAYLDPQQLAQSLPVIIPPLTGVLNDSHKEVRLAANRSLKRFGEVINNPEIKSLVDVLLKALSDPTKYTDDALDSLIRVSFVHYLDAPSLALVVRILERGLGDRSTTKRKSSQVIGSLAHLTERKDLVSHLPILVAGLKNAVVDPVPTTRATASKALGSLIEKLGEEALPDLIPGLMHTLKSDTTAGDRLGSAQALSEVLAGLGTTRLEETLPTILHNVVSSKPSVREGFMSMFIFLPVCFGNSFANYLSKIIPPILSGLADDVETIRDTSLRAGRLLVKNFAAKSIDLLLPELERGLADDSYRIRLSSVELVGDLLFNLTGTSAKTDEAEEGAHEAGASLLEVLGEQKRNRVLSALYICRSGDTSGLVRTAAVNVWKALVASPRTLKELIPTLTQLIIRRLGNSNQEQKIIAGNALRELVHKAGDGVLSSLLPTLEKGLQSTDPDAKEGICIALKACILSASPEALEDHEKTLISVVITGLIDSDAGVREAAAEAFDSLQQILGKRAVDQVLPYLLNLLRSDQADDALSALLTLLTETTRSSIILPDLIPTLTTSPISSFNAKALASLSTVAGSAMTRRLPTILNSLMTNIILYDDEQLRKDLEAAFNTVILSIDEFDGLNTTMSVLLTLLKHDDHRRRAATGQHLAKFFASTTVDYSRYNQDIIRSLLISFDDRDSDVIKASWAALNEFMKKLKKEEMETLVLSTRQVLQQVGIAGSNLSGFGLPKGINAILPIFLQGLMNGTPEQRTQAALAISDIVDRTSGDSLKPFVTQITGPLIRVVSERSIDVKSAILLTLNKLLEKIPTLLKPFLPQLQRTFAKCLADTSSEILRTRAALALGTLITLTPRIDPLITELVTGARTADFGVRAAMRKALYEVVSKAGANMNDASRAAVLSLIDMESEDNDITMAITNAKLLGALIKNVPSKIASNLIKNRITNTQFTQSSVLALNAVLLEAPSSLEQSVFVNDLPSLICKGIATKNNFISDNSILVAGKYILSNIRSSDFETLKPIFESLAGLIQPGNSVDSRRLALVVVRTISRHHIDIVRPHLPLLAFPVFASVRDPVIPVKLAAEAAFMALFNVVDEESKIFDKFMLAQELPANQKRIMQDYFKRVALRLGSTARERKEAEGGQGGLGLSNDEIDDEREIWSIGKIDLGERAFDN